jgi:hypothetical protein
MVFYPYFLLSEYSDIDIQSHDMEMNCVQYVKFTRLDALQQDITIDTMDLLFPAINIHETISFDFGEYFRIQG